MNQASMVRQSSMVRGQEPLIMLTKNARSLFIRTLGNKGGLDIIRYYRTTQHWDVRVMEMREGADGGLNHEEKDSSTVLSACKLLSQHEKVDTSQVSCRPPLLPPSSSFLL